MTKAQLLGWGKLAVGGAVLAVLVWRLGSGPFLDGLRGVDATAVATAFAIGVVTTVACAYRWALVARALGVTLPMREAVGAYYRAQFLNTTLPGGVVGDVHRAVRHGKDIGDVALGVRAVVVERMAGFVITIALSVVTLAVFPSPVRRHMPLAVLALAVLGGIAFLVKGRLRLRTGLTSARTGVGVVLTTAAVLAGHLITFLVAARTAGATAPLHLLAPLTLLALLAMALPCNIAGWGPREGVAAWAFGAAGLTSGQGVATAVVFGVLALVASLPGAVVLVLRWADGRRAAREPVMLDHELRDSGVHRQPEYSHG
ncbi:lysylphosphatidylglycerol synthase transmembrane domain-containing protein [Asanoa sp. WMMD1127]|uniref:lysylphosphatidylglycerol synthase transmembrane domain-containing protein n=1 Tax=Asanoa sp. WMMD1127 TaxID=3016107 RepID=UPI0024163823|nr:lysylphosphatidylglycerol synthase transmembrane domain-containing protein [Asanoa sp. WMMD1127]MDG4823454.1 lysylphosphatidylglycerol synthase transmembrane domain-containing protein [Asanoa sp. WMMD1127]